MDTTNDNRNVSLYSFTRRDKWVREAIEFWAIPPLDLDSIFTYDNFQQCYLGQSPKIRKFQSKWQYHREYRGNKSRFLAHKVDKKDRGENQKMENCSMFTSCHANLWAKSAWNYCRSKSLYIYLILNYCVFGNSLIEDLIRNHLRFLDSGSINRWLMFLKNVCLKYISGRGRVVKASD